MASEGLEEPSSGMFFTEIVLASVAGNTNSVGVYRMRKLVAHFAGTGSDCELIETMFTHPSIGEERRCIRGKRSGAYRGCSTFQWTKAVQALALLMVEAAIRKFEPSHAPLLVGRTGSLASSLDYAIDKQTSWLYEMFGWDSKGVGLSRKLLLRSNPGQRMQAPVAISMNLNYLEPANITIMFEYAEVSTLGELQALRTHLLAAIQQEITSSEDRGLIAACA